MESRPGIYTDDIFRLVDLCIDAGWFSPLSDKIYVLLLIWDGDNRCRVHRRQVTAVLPTPCRVWLVKGRTRYLLGDSDALPADLSAGVWPPYFG